MTGPITLYVARSLYPKSAHTKCRDMLPMPGMPFFHLRVCYNASTTQAQRQSLGGKGGDTLLA